MADKKLNSLSFPGLSDRYIIPPGSVFVAYQFGTSAEIESAYQNDTPVFCSVAPSFGQTPVICRLVKRSSATLHYFAGLDEYGVMHFATCDSGTWTRSTRYISPEDAIPQPLGTASAGVAEQYSRGDHVHENNIFAVTYTKTSATTATCDKTYAGIVAAATAGKTIVAVLSGLFPATQTVDISITSATSFNVTAPIGGTGSITISHTSADVISFSQVYGQEEITASGILKGNGAGGVSAAAAGADYIAPPSSPATGAFLVYDGTAWVAQTLPTYNGGSY